MWALFAVLPGRVAPVRLLGAYVSSLADSDSWEDNGTVTIIVGVVGIVFGVIVM